MIWSQVHNTIDQVITEYPAEQSYVAPLLKSAEEIQFMRGTIISWSFFLSLNNNDDFFYL